jgi:hypothetical protein
MAEAMNRKVRLACRKSRRRRSATRADALTPGHANPKGRNRLIQLAD